METTLLRIADFSLVRETNEHLVNMYKNLFLYYGVSRVDISEHGSKNSMLLLMEVPVDDTWPTSRDAIVDWEEAVDKVSHAIVMVDKFIKRCPLGAHDLTSYIYWVPCRHR